MSHQISIEEALAQLDVLLQELKTGIDVVITQSGQPVAKLVPVSKPKAEIVRRAGSAAGLIVSMSDDFDAPLDDLKDYM